MYIYEGFLHAKSWVIDDVVSSVGTTNVNLRSFYAQLRGQRRVYDTDFARCCRQVFEEDLKRCVPLELSTYGFVARAFQTSADLEGR